MPEYRHAPRTVARTVVGHHDVGVAVAVEITNGLDQVVDRQGVAFRATDPGERRRKRISIRGIELTRLDRDDTHSPIAADQELRVTVVIEVPDPFDLIGRTQPPPAKEVIPALHRYRLE